jgi:hypothetical protein
MLDQLIPTPRLLETEHADLAAPPARVWQLLRHADLATSPLIRALFAVRTLPDRLQGKPVNLALRVDDFRSSAEHPGFQLLAEEATHEFAVGAIGKVWQLEIPFVHVSNAADFAAFRQPGFIKVAWAIRTLPRGEQDCRVEFELRVDAVDEVSWSKFEHYFRLIGPASRFIRRTALASLARQLGVPEDRENVRRLPGDELLANPVAQLTDGVTIAARPEAIWPWLLQMGCRRAGFYSIDLLDNGGARSARELHPELLALEVGQTVSATPEGEDGFEVLAIDAPRTLILGGLYDADQQRQLAFAAPRPARFWHITWAFVLEALDQQTTRLHVRARAAFPESGRLHSLWIRPVHHLMQGAMLRHLAARVEGRVPRDDVRDVVEGAGGAAIMLAAFLTPFFRRARNHWGLDETAASRPHPGDELIPEPDWSWTHAVEIDAPAAGVWPWVTQIGAERGGFYSYQWLENLLGCELRNAESVHPEWEVKVGQSLVLHPSPRAPQLPITALEPGHYFVAHAPADEAARARGKAWISGSWLFLVEPLGDSRCRFISRYRAAGSDDVAARLAFGPALLEPIGFAMDRRMLLGVKERAERATPAHRRSSSRAAIAVSRGAATARHQLVQQQEQTHNKSRMS